MQINTTVFNILHSELINNGHNEFFNGTQIIAFEEKESFMNKVLVYDNDVEKIVNNKIFRGLKLDDEKHDKEFKRNFINRFIYWSPCSQTLEIFSSKVCYIFMNNKDFLNEYYSNINDYISGKNTSSNLGNEISTSDNRNLTSTLPQSEVNLDVDNTVLDYGDTNAIGRNKNRSERTGSTESNSYNIANLKELINMLELVFEQFEKECFLKVW